MGSLALPCSSPSSPRATLQDRLDTLGLGTDLRSFSQPCSVIAVAVAAIVAKPHCGLMSIETYSQGTLQDGMSAMELLKCITPAKGRSSCGLIPWSGPTACRLCC